MTREEVKERFGIEPKEELTTEMHAELMEGEMSLFELRVLGVVGAMNRGFTKAEALVQNHLTEEEYDNNVERVLKL
ncbi:MAG: hypothetical protein LUC49_03805 [Prevotella sp.]|nr:hypothetical protein [Prevotella sp.]MCD8305768.1 hypothetical protein [Prevotella sp.]